MSFNVNINQSDIFPEVKIVTPEPYFDYRGELWTVWDKSYDILPQGMEFKISKFTRSYKNVLRGLHGDDITWRYVNCLHGEVYQVVVDNRPESVNYLKQESYILSDRNHTGILIPPGFVNGHLCLSEECVFQYMKSYPDKYVHHGDEYVIKWNDERIGVEWPTDNPILKGRDRHDL